MIISLDRNWEWHWHFLFNFWNVIYYLLSIVWKSQRAQISNRRQRIRNELRISLIRKSIWKKSVTWMHRINIENTLKCDNLKDIAWLLYYYYSNINDASVLWYWICFDKTFLQKNQSKFAYVIDVMTWHDS